MYPLLSKALKAFKAHDQNYLHVLLLATEKPEAYLRWKHILFLTSYAKTHQMLFKARGVTQGCHMGVTLENGSREQKKLQWVEPVQVKTELKLITWVTTSTDVFLVYLFWKTKKNPTVPH